MERASDSTSTSPIYTAKPTGVKLYLGLKRLFYRLCKWIGLFALARRRTRDGLRILCYHGFSLEDESVFSPRTFIEPGTFESRMNHLKRRGIPVLRLGEALELLDSYDLPPNAVVITIDDGFYSSYSRAFPLLRALSFPATVYVTTYYAVKKRPIFRLVVQYMFWKTIERSLDPSGLGISGDRHVPISTDAEKSNAVLRVIRYGENSCDERGRAALATLLGERLGVDYGSMVESRILSIMSSGEIAELSCGGIDIELHSHRHNLPLDREAAMHEIEENRAVLEPLTGGRLVHFCYPSGFYREEQFPWLEEAGIVSATTCERGFNYADTPKLRLKRFLDGEDVSFIEFEAEIDGFSEMMRTFSTVLKKIVGGN